MVLSFFADHKILIYQLLGGLLGRRPGTDHGAGNTRQFQQAGSHQVRSESNRGRRRNRIAAREADALLIKLHDPALLQWVNFASDFVGDQLGGPDMMAHPPNGELGNRTSFAPETA